jgi:hypothetical protein
MQIVTVRFYSYNLLRTIDLNLLLELLASKVPDVGRIVIEAMAKEERGSAAHTDRDGIVMVRERIHLFVSGTAGDERMRDLEAEVGVPDDQPGVGDDERAQADRSGRHKPLSG